MTLNARDLSDLRKAVALLERPGLAIRLTELVGRPVEKLIDALPRGISANIQETTRSILQGLLDSVVKTMRLEYRGVARNGAHRILAGLSGAVGGAFGAPALAVELPITTSFILRSIADIARSEGEDLSLLPARLACLEVFAFGGRKRADDAAETGYYAVRAALAKATSDAVKHIAEKGLTQEGAPAIIRLISALAARFGAVVSEKAAAQTVPVVGALGGATINVVFTSHFQGMARGNFIVRRLERGYGHDAIRAEYEAFAAAIE
ncbi:MAG: EcsC family protein [Vicinamibacteria bacterium]|nr:EcsC family protein [Vicinamibacteria bacterium]